MTFLGETEHFSGKNGELGEAFQWGNKCINNVLEPISRLC